MLLSYIDGLVQERRNSIANALYLRLSGINPSIWQATRSIAFDMYTNWHNDWETVLFVIFFREIYDKTSYGMLKWISWIFKTAVTP